MPNWPSPSYNRIIETDPQIVKVDGAAAEKQGYGWGSRPSLFNNHLTADPRGQNPGPPTAPEMGIAHGYVK